VFYQETSAKSAYTQEQFDKREIKSANVDNKIRQANYNLGNEKLDYSTTNGLVNSNVAFAEAERNEDKRDKQRERVSKGRIAQFSYGHDPVSYDSIAKNAFTSKDLSQSVTAKAERESNGKDLRKTHFSFGNDERIVEATDTLPPTS
jgi:hypothetical protein